MNKISWSFGIITYLWVELGMAGENTNSNTYLTNTIYSQKFISRWTEELIPAGSRIMYDRFGPPSIFIWIRAYDTQRYNIHEYIVSEGEDAVFSIMSAAARESAVTTLPIEEYENEGKSWVRTILSGLIHGSIGNTREEDSPAVSPVHSYGTLRHIIQFEWNDPKDVWNGRYGWRPWRDNPYLYLNNNFGHYQGRQLIRTEIRCYGYLRPNSFGLIKTEARAIISLSKSSQLVLGGYAYPFEDKEKYRPKCSARFEAYWRGSVLSAGVVSTANGPYWNIMYEFHF